MQLQKDRREIEMKRIKLEEEEAAAAMSGDDERVDGRAEEEDVSTHRFFFLLLKNCYLYILSICTLALASTSTSPSTSTSIMHKLLLTCFLPHEDIYIYSFLRIIFGEVQVGAPPNTVFLYFFSLFLFLI